jgi:hypothetical protein
LANTTFFPRPKIASSSGYLWLEWADLASVGSRPRSWRTSETDCGQTDQRKGVIKQARCCSPASLPVPGRVLVPKRNCREPRQARSCVPGKFAVQMVVWFCATETRPLSTQVAFPVGPPSDFMPSEWWGPLTDLLSNVPGPFCCGPSATLSRPTFPSGCHVTAILSDAWSTSKSQLGSPSVTKGRAKIMPTE